MKKEPMFILVGPSASGKTTVAQMLVERQGMKRAITTTTRHQRRGESFDAYHFVKSSEFKTEDMVEYQEYAGNWYGLSKVEADSSNLVIMEPRGARLLRNYCDAQGRPCLLIGLPASKKEQAERMVMRGDSARIINERIAYDDVAFQKLELLCSTICNATTVEKLYDQVSGYILSHIVDRI